MNNPSLSTFSFVYNNHNYSFEVENSSIVSFMDFNFDIRQKINDSISQMKEVGIIAESMFSFPWKNVKENILFGNEKKSQQEIDEIIKFVGLTGYENHYSLQRSFGFNFRIAIARLVLHGYQVICIDNSLQKIAKKSQFAIYDLLVQTVEKFGISFLILTKSLKEALFISNIVLLFDDKNQLVEIPVQFQHPRSHELWNSQILNNLLSKIIAEYNYSNL